MGPPGPYGAPGAAGIVSGVNKILFGAFVWDGENFSNSGTITFSSAFSSTPTVVATCNLPPYINYYTDATMLITSISTTGFTYYVIPGSASFWWIAIN
jgi:hypothetical protein